MKIAVITDQHLDGRKGSLPFWNFWQQFYDEIFSLLLKRRVSPPSLILATHLIIESLWIIILWRGLKLIISTALEGLMYT